MSLRVRLLLTTLSILAVVVSAVALLSGRASVSEFKHFVEADTEIQLDRSAGALADFYARKRSWAGVDTILHSIGRLSGDRLLLVGLEGHPIAATEIDVRTASTTVRHDGAIH